jgi:hypothetical protein
MLSGSDSPPAGCSAERRHGPPGGPAFASPVGGEARSRRRRWSGEGGTTTDG